MSWDRLSMAEKAEVMRLAVQDGIYNLDAIRNGYNEYAKGGKIHIAPSKRGTFTAAASKHGKSVQAFASQVLAHPENYSPAMRKKANFARNASKWKHGLGGNLYDEDNENNQQMQVGRKSPYGGTWLPEVTVNAFEDPMVIIARQNPEYRSVLSQMYEANDSLDNPVITKPQASRLLKVYNLAGSPKLKPLKDGDSRAKIVHPLFGRETIFAGKNVEEGFSDLMAELSHPLQDRFGNNNRIIEHLNPFYSSDDYKGKTRYDFPNKYESETHEDFEPLLNYYIKDNILPGQWYLTDPKEGSLGNDSIVENPGLIQVMDSARVYNKRKQDSKYQYVEPRSERKPRNKIVSFFGDLF